MNPFELFVFFYMLDPQVSAEIEKMAHDSKAVRDAAYKKLVAMDERASRHVFFARTHHKDAEVRMRCRRLAAIQENAIGVESYAWIDCLPKDYPDREQIIESYYKEFKHDQNDDYDACHLKAATEVFVKRLLESGRRRAEIVEMLELMAHNEQQWKDYGGRSSPPPEFDK